MGFRSKNLSFSPWHVLAFAALWTFFINYSYNPFHTIPFFLVVAAYLAIGAWIYRETRFTIPVTQSDLVTFAAYVVILLVAHWPFLFYDLAGDELVHAICSVFPLVHTANVVRWLGPKSLEAARSSYWYLMDPRHVPVIDIWRWVSLIVFAVLGGLYLAVRFVRRQNVPTKRILLLLGFVVLSLFALKRGSHSPHPPLRVFAPFLTALLFGLNPFAFRVSSLFTAALVSLFIYRFVTRQDGKLPTWFRHVLAVAPAFLPTVFYSSEQVEPSIYGYAIATAVLLLVYRFFSEKNSSDLLLAGLLAGLAVNFRVPAILIWIPVVTAFLMVGQVRTTVFALQLFWPALFGVPYLYWLKVHGHAALNQDPAWVTILGSLINGLGIMTIVNSTTLPWLAVIVFAVILAHGKMRARECGMYLFFLPLYAMYYNVEAHLAGAGRYQAEFVAPFVVLTLVYVSAMNFTKAMYGFVALIAYASINTIEVNTNLSLDINYLTWGQMRVTTAANFPYRQALGDLHRDEALGHGLLIGGQPVYGPMVAWFSGFGFAETDTWVAIEQEAEELWKGEPSLPDVEEFLHRHNVRSILLQSGTRRERQHQPEYLQRIYRMINLELEKPQSVFRRVRIYDGQHGGRLELIQYVGR